MPRLFKKEPGPHKAASAAASSSHHQTTDEKNLNKFNHRLEQILNTMQETKTSISNLSAAYEKRKLDTKGYLSFFLPADDPERNEDINFIISVANSISEKTTARKTQLSELREETFRLEIASTRMNAVVTGACIYVMKKIEESYQKAWIRRDPLSSQLYLELLTRVGTQTEEQQSLALQALVSYLENPDIQNIVKFGSHSSKQMLAKMMEYINVLIQNASISVKQ